MSMKRGRKPIGKVAMSGADRTAVEFGVSVGEYHGVVRVHRRTFQRILSASPTPERCVGTYYLNRTRLERIADRKLRRRQLSDDANVEITGRDLRERDAPIPTPRKFAFAR
jgi:hypothetical protein